MKRKFGLLIKTLIIESELRKKMKDLIKLFFMLYVVSYITLLSLEVLINFENLYWVDTYILIMWTALPCAITLMLGIVINKKVENHHKKLEVIHK